MEIQHVAYVYIWPNSHTVFPFRSLPQYQAQWYPWEFGDGALTTQYGGTTNVSHNYEGQHTTASPLRVPCNAILQAGTDAGYDAQFGAMTSAGGYDSSLPYQTWTSSVETGCTYLPQWGGQTDRSLGIGVQATSFAGANSNAFNISTPTEDHQAVNIVASMRPQPNAILASGIQGGTSSATTPSSLFVECNQGPTIIWRVTSVSNGDYQVQWSSDSGSTWVTLAKIPRTSSQVPSASGVNFGNAENLLDVEFRLLSNRMYIRLNDKSQEFKYIADPHNNYITGIGAGGTQFMAATVWGEPIKWDNSMSMTTPVNSAPYSGMTFPFLGVETAPGDPGSWTSALDTSTVNPGTGQPYTQLGGPDLTAKVDFSGPTDGTYDGTAYSNLTAIVRSFYTTSTPTDDNPSSSQFQVFPERIVITHQFDQDALTIHSVAKLFFNNFDGSWGDWMINTGQVAVQIWVARTLTNGSMSEPVLTFTGYGHCEGEIEGTQGGSMFVMTCGDRMMQLGTPRWDLPRMDGWNQFYAASYLAQLGGFVPDDLYFNYLVPPDQYGDLGDQFGDPAPFLSIGDSGSLQNKYANGNIDEILVKQANPIGYMIFTDVGGELHFEKFQLAAGIKRVFCDSDMESGLETGDATNGLTMVSVRKNMKEVRTDFAIIGVNSFTPYWNPIIERRPVTPASNPLIFDPTQYNYIGYQNMGQWLDGIFANETFASNAADYMYTIFQLPGLDVSMPTMWVQPDIFPLDSVCYSGDRVPINSVPLMVTKVTHDITIARATSDIEARYIPGSPNLPGGPITPPPSNT